MNDDVIRDFLRRRRGKIISFNPTNSLLFPSEIENDKITEFYNLMKDYSFRLLLRELIKRKSSFKEKDVERFLGVKKTSKYLNRLVSLSVIKNIEEDSYQLVNQNVRSFGDTFEWFIAEIFSRELLSPSAFGIRVRGLSLNGDIDAIAIVEGYCVYVEVKSSPPRNIELNNISAFLSRISTLSSNMAIFIEDTELRMSDKIIPLFYDAFLKRKSAIPKHEIENNKIVRLQNETFTLQRKLYITNTHPDVVTNLCFCVKDFLKHQGLYWV